MERYQKLWCKLCDSKDERKIRRFLSKSIQHNIGISYDVIENMLSNIPLSEMIDNNLIKQYHQGDCEAVLWVPEKLAKHPYFNQEMYRILFGNESLKHISNILSIDIPLSCTNILLYPGSMSLEDFKRLRKLQTVNEIFGLNENFDHSSDARKLLQEEVKNILLSKAIEELMKYRYELDIDKEVTLLKDYLEKEIRAGEILAMSYNGNKICLKRLKDQLKFLNEK